MLDRCRPTLYGGSVPSSLRTLVADQRVLAEEELARGLRPYMRFTSEGQLLPERSFDVLPAEHRVLCVLLAVQALRLLQLRETDDATPAQISALSGMPPGTVRPKLSALLRDHRVAKTGSRYSLPLHSARHALDLLGTR